MPAVKDIPNLISSGSVLDVGCGTGRHALFLARLGFTVSALDPSQENLLELKNAADKESLSIKLIHNNILHLRSKKQYDVVLAAWVLHFLQHDRISTAIEYIQGITKENGINVVSVLTDNNPAGCRPYLFKKDELREYYTNPHWQILSYKETLSRGFRKFPDEPVIQQHVALLTARKIS